MAAAPLKTTPPPGKRRYVMIAVILFAVEVAIALRWIGGDFVRGSLGDVLAVMLVYSLLRAATKLSMMTAATIALAVGFLVETLQYVHLAERLGFARGSVMYVLIGNTFSTMDLLMYALGAVLAYALDRLAVGRATA